MKISEVKNALTLEQLEEMDGHRVLVLDTIYAYGGFYRIVADMRIAFPLYFDDELSFSDYGKTWIAIADQFGVLGVEK